MQKKRIVTSSKTYTELRTAFLLCAFQGHLGGQLLEFLSKMQPQIKTDIQHQYCKVMINSRQLCDI